EARADDALVVAAALLFQRLEKGLFGPPLAVADVGKVADRAAASSGSHRFVLTDTHALPSSQKAAADCRVTRCSEEFNRWAIRLQCYDRFFPVWQPTHPETVAPLLAEAVLRPYLLDLHVKELLDRDLDLQLGRPLVDLERVRVAVRRLVRSLFSDEGTNDD